MRYPCAAPDPGPAMNVPRAVAHVAAYVRARVGDNEAPMKHYAALEQEYLHLYGRLPEGYPIDNADAEVRERAIHAAMHARTAGALCLSGGGIRSASFALGVVQGLARRGLVGTFDFLSTVSGGGYTGAWLSAWLFHAQREGHE